MAEAKKEKLLPRITDIVYDRNMLVVKYEEEKDQYRRDQLLAEVGELEEKIAKIIKEK